MIRGYSDQAANERTFLAWIRTAISVIAFGFVVEKFNLFLLTIASEGASGGEPRVPHGRLPGPVGRYDGLALIVVGIAVIVVAAVRFLRTARMLADQETHVFTGVRAEVVLSAALALIVAGLSVYLVID
jgi:putative membrane protein